MLFLESVNIVYTSLRLYYITICVDNILLRGRCMVSIQTWTEIGNHIRRQRTKFLDIFHN